MLRRELRKEGLVGRILQASTADIGDTGTRRDRVHPNIVAGELERDLTHQLSDAGFGHHVGRADELLDLGGGDRRRDNDAAAAAPSCAERWPGWCGTPTRDWCR